MMEVLCLVSLCQVGMTVPSIGEMSRLHSSPDRVPARGRLHHMKSSAHVRLEGRRRFKRRSQNRVGFGAASDCARNLPSDTMQPGGQQPVAKFVLIKTSPNDTYINPDHVV